MGYQKLVLEPAVWFSIIHLDRKPVVGWDSWYVYGDDVNEDKFLSNLEGIIKGDVTVTPD